MWTTGLVSLSVHEALTFDGVEIALHPDLFSDPNHPRQGVVGRPIGNASIGSSVIQNPLHRRTGSDSLVAVSSDDNKTDSDVKPPIVNSASFSTTNSFPSKRLEVGDMIEIRVWDQLPGSTKGSPQTLKRRSPPTSKDVSRGGSGSNSVIEGPGTRKTSSTSKTLEAAASTLKLAKSVSEVGSLQYSADSSFPNFESKAEPPKEGDMSTVSSAERSKDVIEIIPESPSPKDYVPNTVTAQSQDNRTSGMPPTFPRNKEDTADGNARLQTSKPPPVQRTRTSTTAPADTNEHRRRVQNAGIMKLAGGHVRDISDMTMDTILGANIAPESAETCDDGEEDDTLSRISSTHSLRLSFVMLVSERTLTSLKESARTQVSMLRQVADLYNLSSYDMVTVNRISKDEEQSVLHAVSADFVTVTIKEQYISRGDMHFFQNSLVGRWIYEGQRLSNKTKGVQAHAREIRHGKRMAKSGIITADTMITFRSRSARIFWLVQMSSEMWDYAAPYRVSSDEESCCEIYFDRFVSFMHRLFEKWQELEVTHSLTVVFFSRTYLSSNQGLGQAKKQSRNDKEEKGTHNAQDGDNTFRNANVDICGRLFEDHFKTVIENETTTDWDSLIVRIKREFVRYPFEVGWNLSDETGRRPSTAAQGNLLEAVNITLNLMQFHFMDRDLHRVGNSLVIISAGCGLFEVDRNLAGITYQRMMDNGIGSDMLSLGLPPLHTAPFFHYNNDLVGVEAHGYDDEKNYHEVPHWMHLSFFSYGNEAYSDNVERPKEMKASIEVVPGYPLRNIEMAPHGFYIPNLQNEAEQSRMRLDARRASFSAMANVAASPVFPSKSQSRQRQLISGRSFFDILEACRPGTTRHSMPSALSSLLELYEAIHKRSEDASSISRFEAEETDAHESHSDAVLKIEEHNNVRSGNVQLKEWGAVDFDAAEAMMSQSPTALGMKRQHETGISLHSEQMSDRSSPTSSFSSAFSSLMGRSLERPTSLYSYGGGFHLRNRKMVDGIQMQRSPSLESLFIIRRDSVNEDRNDQSGTATENSGNLDTQKETEFDENLRQLMKQRDNQFFQNERTNLMNKRTLELGSMRGSDESVESGGTMPISNVMGAPQAVGGLGEALKSYNSSSDQNHVATETNLNIKRNMSFSKAREFSQAKLQYSLSRSLGPLHSTPTAIHFRPPVLPSRGNGSDPLDSLGVPHVIRPGLGGEKRSSSVGFLVASSPPRSNNIGQKTRSPPSDSDDSPIKRLFVSKKGHHSKQRSRPLNPFKQQDEEAVLAERSHNRRRWSHVFPLGEIEFKRHAGPNWKSLTQPAILPLTIDYYPPPQELNTFLIRLYDIELDLEGSQYKSPSDLMMEMIRQRLTQDYQVVPQSVVHESRRRDEAAAHLVTQERSRSSNSKPGPSPIARNFLKPENVPLGRGPVIKFGKPRSPTGSPRPIQDGVVEHNLSMGHTIHVLRYDPDADEKKIVVKQLSRKRPQDNSFHYNYMLFSPTTQTYVKVIQDFHEFSREYRWNQVDHLIGGIESKKVAAEMRFRQVSFALIPEVHNSMNEEQAYIEKFQKLLDYLNKLREGDDKEGALDIKVISSGDARIDPKDRVLIVRREAVDMMKRITVQLRKGKRDLYEWIDIAVDPDFDTKRSYRIIVQWLAASASKVETQLQLIQRRCSQFGLKLIGIPELSMSPNLYLNPLHAPSFLCIRKKEDADLIDDVILERGFVDDGIHLTEKTFLDCIDMADEYQFGRRRRVAARQFVHRSGTLFLRLLRDENGSVILVGIENRMLTEKDSRRREVARAAFRRIEAFVKRLPSAVGSQN